MIYFKADNLMTYLHSLTKTTFVTTSLVTFFMCSSAIVTALPIKVSDSLEVTIDSSTEELNIETRYMTYYTVKGRGESGDYGSFNIVEPVDKKLKADIGSIEWKGLRPIITFDPSVEFKTSTSKVEFTDILPVGQDWKNSEIAFQGANLLELATKWPSSETEQNHALMLALLNLSILPEIIADGAGSYKDLKGSNGLRGADTLNDFLAISGEIKNWKQNLKKWNAALSMTEALIEVLDFIAEEMEVDPNTIDSLRPVYDTLKVVQLISKKLEKVSGQFIPRDQKIKDDLTLSIAKQYEKAGISATGSTEKQVWKDIGKAYKSSDDKNKFIISVLLEGFSKGLRAWETKSIDEATQQRIKRERLLLGMAAIAFAGPDIIDIIENDPDAALQFITDISIGALQEVLSYKNTSLIIQNGASKYLSSSTSATISAAAKGGGKLLSAVKIGATAGNRLLPYLYDLIGAPNRLSASINNGELSLFDPVEKRIQVIKINTEDNIPVILWDSKVTPTENPTVKVQDGDDVRVLVSIQQNGLFGKRALWNTSSYVAPQNFFTTYISQSDNYSATDSCLRKLGFFIDPLITIRRTNNNPINPSPKAYIQPQCADGSLNGNSEFFTANGVELKLYNNDDLPIQYRLEGIDIENNPTVGMLFVVDEALSPITINTSGIGSSNPETVEIQLVEDVVEDDLEIPTNFSATRTNGNNVNLTWDTVEGADGYNIYIFKNGKNSTGSDIEEIQVTETLLPLVLDKTKTFFVVIEAYNDIKTSEVSDFLEIPVISVALTLSLPSSLSREEGQDKFVPFTITPLELKDTVDNVTCSTNPSIGILLGTPSKQGVSFTAPVANLISNFTLNCKALSLDGSVLSTSNNLVVTVTQTVIVNNPPVASINGTDGDIRLQITVDEGASVNLDANSSSDPDSDTLTYKWLVAGTVLNETISFSKVFDVGVRVVTLQVNDGKVTSEAKVRIEVKEEQSEEFIVHNGTTYGKVTSPNTGRVWLDRNLGASQVCTSSDDINCFGDYYQWGRNTDGHEKKDSLTTTIQITDLNNTGSNFILASPDWVSNIDSTGSLRSSNWKKSDGSSVCPLGFRVPSVDELRAEVNESNAFLNLPFSGIRYHFDIGQIVSSGEFGDYRTTNISSLDPIKSSTLRVSVDPNQVIGNIGLGDSTYGFVITGAGYGTSVRCVNDIPISKSTGKLNDTGITQCADNSSNNLACPVSTHPSQDAQSGRDVTHNDDSDGHAGFSFTKISSTGNELPASATQWSCVKDNVTGLMWEVKTNDGGLHDKDNYYTWYNPNSSTNGGNAGTESSTANNNSYQFASDVNTTNFCGASDWRVPNREELRSIVDYSITSGIVIDTRFFMDNTSSVQLYLSSSTVISHTDFAWYIDFNDGIDRVNYKYSHTRVRLVRSQL